MRKYALAAAAVAALTTTAALAADLPSRRAPPVYVPPPPPAFTWTGFYVGGNVGGGFDDYTTYGLAGQTAGARNALLVTGARPAFFSTNTSGVVGGGQIGYNFQIPSTGLLGGTLGSLGSGFGNVVGGVGNAVGLGSILGAGGSTGGVIAGLEADAAYTDFHTIGVFAGGTGLTSQFNTRTDFIGTVRGRLGYAFGNLLLYGTGGFAYGGVHDNVALFNAAGVTTAYNGVNRIQTGYTYGGGAEFAIPTNSFVNVFKASAVTVKVEYLHYVLGDNVALVPVANGNVYTARVLNDGNLVRAGINYKFGSVAAAPVVARY